MGWYNIVLRCWLASGRFYGFVDVRLSKVGLVFAGFGFLAFRA